MKPRATETSKPQHNTNTDTNARTHTNTDAKEKKFIVMAEDNISIFLVFFATLLALVLILSQFLHDSKKLSSIIPEAAMVIAIGMGAGYFIHVILGKRLASIAANNNSNSNANNDDDQATVEDELAALLSFDPEFFFLFLLPPIIFNTGLRMGPLFFRHIKPIILCTCRRTCRHWISYLDLRIYRVSPRSLSHVLTLH